MDTGGSEAARTYAVERFWYLMDTAAKYYPTIPIQQVRVAAAALRQACPTLSYEQLQVPERFQGTAILLGDGKTETTLQGYWWGVMNATEPTNGTAPAMPSAPTLIILQDYVTDLQGANRDTMSDTEALRRWSSILATWGLVKDQLDALRLKCPRFDPKSIPLCLRAVRKIMALNVVRCALLRSATDSLAAHNEWTLLGTDEAVVASWAGLAHLLDVSTGGRDDSHAVLSAICNHAKRTWQGGIISTVLGQAEPQRPPVGFMLAVSKCAEVLEILDTYVAAFSTYADLMVALGAEVTARFHPWAGDAGQLENVWRDAFEFTRRVDKVSKELPTLQVTISGHNSNKSVPAMETLTSSREKFIAYETLHQTVTTAVADSAHQVCAEVFTASASGGARCKTCQGCERRTSEVAFRSLPPPNEATFKAICDESLLRQLRELYEGLPQNAGIEREYTDRLGSARIIDADHKVINVRDVLSEVCQTRARQYADHDHYVVLRSVGARELNASSVYKEWEDILHMWQTTTKIARIAIGICEPGKAYNVVCPAESIDTLCYHNGSSSEASQKGESFGHDSWRLVLRSSNCGVSFANVLQHQRDQLLNQYDRNALTFLPADCFMDYSDANARRLISAWAGTLLREPPGRTVKVVVGTEGAPALRKTIDVEGVQLEAANCLPFSDDSRDTQTTFFRVHIFLTCHFLPLTGLFPKVLAKLQGEASFAWNPRRSGRHSLVSPSVSSRPGQRALVGDQLRRRPRVSPFPPRGSQTASDASCIAPHSIVPAPLSTPQESPRPADEAVTPVDWVLATAGAGWKPVDGSQCHLQSIKEAASGRRGAEDAARVAWDHFLQIISQRINSDQRTGPWSHGFHNEDVSAVDRCMSLEHVRLICALSQSTRFDPALVSTAEWCVEFLNERTAGCTVMQRLVEEDEAERQRTATVISEGSNDDRKRRSSDDDPLPLPTPSRRRVAKKPAHSAGDPETPRPLSKKARSFTRDCKERVLSIICNVITVHTSKDSREQETAKEAVRQLKKLPCKSCGYLGAGHLGRKESTRWDQVCHKEEPGRTLLAFGPAYLLSNMSVLNTRPSHAADFLPDDSGSDDASYADLAAGRLLTGFNIVTGQSPDTGQSTLLCVPSEKEFARFSQLVLQLSQREQTVPSSTERIPIACMPPDDDDLEISDDVDPQIALFIDTFAQMSARTDRPALQKYQLEAGDETFLALPVRTRPYSIRRVLYTSDLCIMDVSKRDNNCCLNVFNLFRVLSRPGLKKVFDASPTMAIREMLRIPADDREKELDPGDILSNPAYEHCRRTLGVSTVRILILGPGPDFGYPDGTGLVVTAEDARTTQVAIDTEERIRNFLRPAEEIPVVLQFRTSSASSHYMLIVKRTRIPWQCNPLDVAVFIPFERQKMECVLEGPQLCPKRPPRKIDEFIRDEVFVENDLRWTELRSRPLVDRKSFEEVQSVQLTLIAETPCITRYHAANMELASKTVAFLHAQAMTQVATPAPWITNHFSP